MNLIKIKSGFVAMPSYFSNEIIIFQKLEILCASVEDLAKHLAQSLNWLSLLTDYLFMLFQS